MNVLWQHLQEMAKAQLFNGGYLAGPAVRSIPEQSIAAGDARERTIRRNDGTPARNEPLARLGPALCR